MPAALRRSKFSAACYAQNLSFLVAQEAILTFDYLSDVHLEFFRSGSELIIQKTFARYWTDVFLSRKGDVLLIARDILTAFTDPKKAEIFFDLASQRWERVFCVLGNHDYWGDLPFREVKPKLASDYPEFPVEC